MAGDWIKVETVTPDKPEVFEIARSLGLSEPEAFGRLFLVWRWFDQHTETGDAPSVTVAYLDRIAGVAGFANAMRDVGWLLGGEDSKSGLTLPNFDYHNGKTAKTRALTARRQVTLRSRSRNDEVTQAASPREEKRRSTPIPPSGFLEFWSRYPRKVGKRAALKAWNKARPDPQLIGKILTTVDQQKSSDQWRKDNGEYIPHPATWLNEGRWDDEPPPPPERKFVI